MKYRDEINHVIRLAQVVRPAAGGIRRHVSLLLSRLDPAEFASTLFAPPEFTCDPPVPASRRVSFPIPPRTSLLPDIRAIASLSRLLRGNFDLVHAHGLRGALVAVPAAQRAGVPALFTAHNLVPPTGRVQRWLLRFLSRNAAVVAVSQAVADSLTAQGVQVDHIHIVPNGIDPTEFDTPVRDEHDRRATLADLVEPSAPVIAAWLRDPCSLSQPLLCVAAVGRLAPEKGFDILIASFAQLQARQPADIHATLLLVLAGTGPEEAHLRTLAAPVRGIILPGFVTNVAQLLRSVDVVAIPSREEGQGLVALEAMASRKPVVAAHVGGLVETIQKGETGLLVPPGDPSALSEALSTLLASSELRTKMGNAGRVRVEESYTLDVMVSQLSALYRRLSLSYIEPARR